MLDLLEIADLFLSWRLYVGLGLTAAACYGTYAALEPSASAIPSVVVIGIVGVFLSFRWQIRAD